jgi:phytoene dehydrogenase-like protein
VTTAVVVGAGPNGLAAAIQLARNGFDVQVLEAADTIGGGSRSGELTVPGVIHDHCSAAHPLAVGSPFWAEIDLTSYGLTWKWPEVDCAHPLDDGTAGVLFRSIDKTVAAMGADGRRWRLAVADLAAGFGELCQDLMRPILHVPRHPVRLAAFGSRGVLPAAAMVRWFRTAQGRALYQGMAAHGYARADRPLTAAMALMFIASGHHYGWPVAEGGSGSIIAALAAVLDLRPAAVVQIYGDAMPGRITRSYRRYREGSSAFKVDYAIEGHIPWINPECRRAGIVHLGGTFAEVAHSERERAQGRMYLRPFIILGQQYLADPSRSAGNINPIYAYAHVPFGYPGDATEIITNQIERFAPGFRDRIVATVSKSTAQLEAYNANFVGGDIIGGANDRLQVLFRPRVAIDPYFTGVPGVYLCSQYTPPGGAIHGLCGYHAAQSALRRFGVT